MRRLAPLVLAAACVRSEPAIEPTPPKSAAVRSTEPVDLVDPFIGTGGHGHTHPAATLPFGMVQLGPDTRLEGWDACAGYHHDDTRLHGFSHTHLSGTGIPDYADVLMLPTTRAIEAARDPARAAEPLSTPFDHAHEHASPGEYRVTLPESGIEVELTATARTGIHRYRLPTGAEPAIHIDLRHRDRVIEAELRRIGPREIAGHRRSSSWARDQRVYFVARFSRDVVAIADRGATRTIDGVARGEDVRALLELAPGTEPIVIKVGISAVDVEGARRNLDAEAPHWDFERYRAEARATWNRALSTIAIEGGDEARRRVFLTALYHALLTPNLFEDADGRYRGLDLAVHDSPDHVHYSVFSLWDTFRAVHPLLAILDPDRTRDFVATMLAHDRDGGSLPVWELAGNETGTMIGYHAVSVIADAWHKGIRGFDGERALAAMIRSADRDHLGLSAYRAHGYVPADAEHESVSKTLEYAYDDWCIAEMAGALGRTAERDRFGERAQFWENLFDRETGLMRPRLNGGFPSPFDPREVNVHYTEANAWQYGFFVPHDVGGLIARHGGPIALAERLDALFATTSAMTGREQVDITGLIGQYAHGNEPSHHVAYLYPYVGRAHRTQELVRRIMDELYGDRPDGLSGNDDCGQMSAWYVFGALGFYPVTPGSDVYVIGAPRFPRAVMALPSGRRFVIEAPAVSDAHLYVQSASLNGRPLETALLHHADLVAGGTLRFEMGAKPTAWGTIAPPPPLTSGPNALVPGPIVAPADPSFAGRIAVTLTSPRERAAIHYTLDGSAPTARSPIYRRPLAIVRTTTLRAIAVLDGRASRPIESTFHRRPEGRTVALGCPYTPQYSAGGAIGLVDGLRGQANWRLGGWQGHQGHDFEAVLDLGRIRAVRRLASGYLQDANAWIWMPKAVHYAVSLDGRSFRDVGTVGHDIPTDDVRGTHVRELALALPPTRARYVRVHAINFGTIPDWHPGHGNPAFVFVDELSAE